MLPFILTSLAGFSTLIGSVLIFIKTNPKKIINFSLSFSAGIMLTVSFIDLIPASINYLIKTDISKNTLFIKLFICLIIGIIFIHLLNKILDKKHKNKELYSTGIFACITMILHNIPEGMITYITASENKALGIAITLAIALHNIPEGMSISVPIYYSSYSKIKAIMYTLVAALSEPFGALLTFLFLKPFITNQTTGLLLAVIAGIMIYISFFKLLKQALKYKNIKRTILSFIIGIIFMYITIIMFNL